jgi:RND family efflux transporter MFP subunit
MSRALLPIAAFALLALGACSEDEPAPPPPIRPVLSVVVAPQIATSVSFTGTVEPRFSHDLGFRVLGRVVARDVDVGQPVQAGQVIASLDPTAFGLAVRQLEAELAKAEATLANAAATRQRKAALLAERVASQADLETAEQAGAAAEAAVLTGRAALDKAREQLGYTRLISETDGIVTAVNAEVGQTVTAGQTVVKVAEADVREAVVDVPDEIAQAITPGDVFVAAVQIDPSATASGRVREVAPQADAATRTRRVRITLDAPPPAFRLGTTVTASRQSAGLAEIDLPRSALLKTQTSTAVWLVDDASGTVSLRTVKVASETGDTMRIESGIDVGARVVTAGVNSLSEGQKVKVEQEIVP